MAVLTLESGGHMEPVISASAGTDTITITGCTTSMGTALVCTILLVAFMPFTQAVFMVVAFMAAEGIAEEIIGISFNRGCKGFPSAEPGWDTG